MITAATRLEQLTGELPSGFAAMRSEALAEGYRFLETLAADWATCAVRFDRDGELLLAAYRGKSLAAIGGITIEPVIPGALRMRRFYIRAPFRRSGIGRILATALLDRAMRSERPVTVNAATGSAPFWESLGFAPDMRDGHTHVLVRNA